MTFLADESVDRPIIVRLRADGHDVTAVDETAPSLPDDEVLAWSVREGVVLISSDKDFGELIYGQRMPHAGILFLRIADLTVDAMCVLVSRTVADVGDQLPGAFTVLTPETLRIRRSVT